MSVTATATVVVSTTVTQSFVIPASLYAGFNFAPVAVGDGTYILAHNLHTACPPTNADLAANVPLRCAGPNSQANYIVGNGPTPIANAISKGCLVFASLSDAQAAST